MLSTATASLPIGPLDAVVASERTGRWRTMTEPLRVLIRESRVHGLWIAAWSVVGWVGTMLMPILDGHDFILMLLSPRALFAAMAADSVNIVPFVILGTARLAVTDASYFIIGRNVPAVVTKKTSRTRSDSKIRRRLRSWMEQSDRCCRWLSSRPALAGSVLFLRPNGKYLAFAGAYGVSRTLAGFCSVAGTMIFLTALHLGLAAAF